MQGGGRHKAPMWVRGTSAALDPTITMRPSPRLCHMAGARAWASRKGAWTLTSGGLPGRQRRLLQEARCSMPATWASMLTGLPLRDALGQHGQGLQVAQVGHMGRDRQPFGLGPPVHCSRMSASRSMAATGTPWRSSIWAVWAPMPRAAPVTTAVPAGEGECAHDGRDSWR